MFQIHQKDVRGFNFYVHQTTASKYIKKNDGHKVDTDKFTIIRKNLAYLRNGQFKSQKQMREKI